MHHELILALQFLILPPGGPLLMVTSGVLLRAKKMSAFLIITGTGLLYLATISATTCWLHSLVPVYKAVDPNSLNNGVIVVLGGGAYHRSPEYNNDSINAISLERIRYAAWLQKQTGLPIMTSGGSVDGVTTPEGTLMRDTLENEFHAKVSWTELKSKNTYQNAINSAAILRELNIGNIILVTHAYHMYRAVSVFEKAKLSVTPAPTVYFRTQPSSTWIMDWIPSGPASFRNWLLMRELLGRFWYWLNDFA